MADPSSDPSHSSFSYETSPQLFLFTSLTAGSSHVITATSRLETILKANRIPFRAIDCATDEKARRIWGRRAGKRKLPGLVREGMVLADMEAVEEWNEYGELKERLAAPVDEPSTTSSPAPSAATEQQSGDATSNSTQRTLPIREAFTGERSSRSRTPPSATQEGREALAETRAENLHSTSPSAGLPALYKPPVTRPTKISFESPQDSLSGIRGGSALATPNEPMTASAGPAKTSGLAAVTSDPGILAAAAEKEKDRGRGRANDGDALPEAEPEAQIKSVGARVKFEEDQLKGDARDGRAAEDSVGD